MTWSSSEPSTPPALAARVQAWWLAAPPALRLSTLLWVVSAVTGAVAVTAGQWPSQGETELEPGEELFLVGFWVVLVLLLWGGRAVAAVVMLARRADLARAFLLLLGPFGALINDVAAVLMSHGEAAVVAVAGLDAVLVAAATVLMYRPQTNAALAAVLAERAAALHAYTGAPLAPPVPDTATWTGPALGGPQGTTRPAHAGTGGPTWWRPTNTLAILALVFAFTFPLLAPVFGIAARNQIAHSGEQGSGMAVTGIAVGLGWLLLFVGLFGGVWLLGPHQPR